MSGNSFGTIFKLATCGESHGGAVAVTVDGCPSGLEINESDIQKDLDRRKPGQSLITTQRNEADKIHILSGVFEGKTTGTPILMLAYNHDAKSEDYAKLKDVFRPSHADYTYLMKYGVRDYRGSGRASARETLARVAAGAVAKKYLKEKLGIEILSYVEQVGDIKSDIAMNIVNHNMIDANIVRCPDAEASLKMITLIEKVKLSGDSIGGVIRCIIRNVPLGLGEPVFDKLNADLGKAMLSINAVKGFEIGSGFAGVGLLGSEHNDQLQLDAQQNITTKTNYAGGVVGGISNGEDIYCRIAFKAVSTIRKAQQTLNLNKEEITLAAEGRHDPCVLPRAVPVVDAMAALVIMDHYLRQNAYKFSE
ncbi:MAG: chorismate synthase [Proteobacteria bacterium]|jgi:chorismate synthase|nr:chorismate synthase [Pseudomonadota bacterium]